MGVVPEDRHQVRTGTWRNPRHVPRPARIPDEPHTGKQIPLGTREVDAYDMPELLYDKILYVEKKGMHPIFREARLAERYDLAIVCAEGYASREPRPCYRPRASRT